MNHAVQHLPADTLDGRLTFHMARLKRSKDRHDIAGIRAELQTMLALVRVVAPVDAEPKRAISWQWMRRDGTKAHAFQIGTDGYVSMAAECGSIVRTDKWRESFANSVVAPGRNCAHCLERVR